VYNFITRAPRQNKLCQCRTDNRKSSGNLIRINTDPDVYWIAPKMSQIYCLVSHFAKFLKCSIPQWWKNGEVIQNPHADPDQRQKLITSGGSPLHKPTMFGRRPETNVQTEWMITLPHPIRLGGALNINGNSKEPSQSNMVTGTMVLCCPIIYTMLIKKLFTSMLSVTTCCSHVTASY